jgi:hypothetical protein
MQIQVLQINKLYNNNNTQTITNDIEKLNNGNYIFPFSSFNDLKLIITDSIGNINKELLLELDDTLVEINARKSIIIKNNLIIFLSRETAFVDTTKYFVALTCYNYNLDTIWNKKYLTDTLRVFPNSFCQTNDGGFAIAGNIDKGGSSYDAFILKLDSLGNQEWYNEYGSNKDEVITNIIQANDNSFIIAGYTRLYTYEDWYILRADSLGNQIWDWVFHNPLNVSELPVSDLIQTQDGNFVAVGSKAYIDVAIGGLYKSRLLKFDINKNIILDTLYTEKADIMGLPDDEDPFQYWSYFGKIQELDNGNFIVINYKKIPTFNTYNNSNIYFLDSNFNLIKKVNFGSVAWGIAGEFIKDFVVEPDGSLTMIGDINSNYNDPFPMPTQRVWFIKTDTNYCDGFGSCDSLYITFFIPDSISITDTSEIKFKINSNYSGTFNVWINYKNDHISSVEHEIMYNLSPDSIYALAIDKQFALEHINDTLYLNAKIVPSDSLYHNLIYTLARDNIVLFYDPIGIQELQKVEAKISIYPNPATNSLTLTLSKKEGINKNTSVFIYDVYGRVVHVIASEAWQSVSTDSHPDKSGQAEQSSRYNTIKIDISNLEKGVYFVKIGSAVGRFVKE